MASHSAQAPRIGPRIGWLHRNRRPWTRSHATPRDPKCFSTSSLTSRALAHT